MDNCIPIVDISDISLTKSDSELDYRTVAKEIYVALSTVGFVYLKNHGISDIKLNEIFRLGKQFFSLPRETKLKYKLTETNKFNGWGEMGREILDHNIKHVDLKETYNLHALYDVEFPIPEQEIPGFGDAMWGFNDICCSLTTRLLKAIGVGLNLQDEDYLANIHTWEVGNGCNSLRLLRYPALESIVNENQTRLGEHCDYGTITLLFQDQVGGLEVKHSNGQFVPATPIEGTILINLGEFMQRWTSDRLKATVHRVRCDHNYNPERQSIAFFCSPPNAVLAPLDGSDKYTPVNGRQYVIDKVAKQHGVYN